MTGDSISDSFWDFSYQHYLDKTKHASGPDRLNKQDFIAVMKEYFRTHPEQERQWPDSLNLAQIKADDALRQIEEDKKGYYGQGRNQN